MRASFLLPARNAESTLGEALADVLAQRDVRDYEVVCVDDASTDETPRILADAAKRDARIKVVRGLGRGLVAALNEGLRHCRGDFIARMDADDRTAPHRLRTQLALFETDPQLGAVGSLIHCFPESPGLARLEQWLNGLVTKEQCRNAIFIEAPLVHPSTTFRREALEAAGGWQDHGWAEDWDLLVRLVQLGWDLAKVPDVLLHWRDSDARLTRTAPVYAPVQMMKLRAHYLARGPLAEKPFSIWGAGPTGKRLARELEHHGKRPRIFYDVARNKHFARGRPVRGESELPPPGDELIVCAVGAFGARTDIRAVLEPRGYVEGVHFLFAS